MIRGERKDGGFKLEMSNLDRIILSMALHFLKEHYFEELEKAANKGPSMIHPDLIRKTYQEFLDTLEI